MEPTANYDRHELCELVGNMADYYVQGITEPVDEWLFEPASASHADTIDLTSTDPDEGDETGKVGAMGIPATEIPFPYTTNDVVAKQLRELIAQGLVFV